MAEPPFGHESSSIAVRPLLGVVAIFAVAATVSVIVIGLVLNDRIAPRHAQVVARPGTIPPAPRLQPDPRGDLAALRTQKQRLLSDWAWTDATHEFARIPIARAMVIYQRQHASPEGAAASPSAQDSDR